MRSGTSSYWFDWPYSEITRGVTISQIVNSVFNSITYIIPTGNQNDCWLVDCGDVEKVIAEDFNVRGVLLTHTHFDHIYGLNKLVGTFPEVVIYTNAIGKESLQNPKWNFSRYHPDVDDFVLSHPGNVRIIEGEGLVCLDDSIEIEVFFTPGHDPSCMAFRINDFLFTGDSYIPGVKVVTTFPRSDKQKASESLLRLCRLEESGLKVKSGHCLMK